MQKIDEIKLLLSDDNSTNILGLTETFLSDEIDDKELTINCFDTERKDRKHKKGGGILIYISESINYLRRYDLEHDNIEAI